VEPRIIRIAGKRSPSAGGRNRAHETKSLAFRGLRKIGTEFEEKRRIGGGIQDPIELRQDEAPDPIGGLKCVMEQPSRRAVLPQRPARSWHPSERDLEPLPLRIFRKVPDP